MRMKESEADTGDYCKMNSDYNKNTTLDNHNGVCIIVLPVLNIGILLRMTYHSSGLARSIGNDCRVEGQMSE